MYAIIKTGGKQYKVTEGEIVKVELLKVNEGDEVTLETILAADGDNVVVGADAANVKVVAEVIGDGKGKKLNIFRYKAKKNVRKRKGHRQPFTALKIKSITL